MNNLEKRPRLVKPERLGDPFTERNKTWTMEKYQFKELFGGGEFLLYSNIIARTGRWNFGNFRQKFRNLAISQTYGLLPMPCTPECCIPFAGQGNAMRWLASLSWNGVLKGGCRSSTVGGSSTETNTLPLIFLGHFPILISLVFDACVQSPTNFLPFSCFPTGTSVCSIMKHHACFHICSFLSSNSHANLYAIWPMLKVSCRYTVIKYSPIRINVLCNLCVVCSDVPLRFAIVEMFIFLLLL